MISNFLFFFFISLFSFSPLESVELSKNERVYILGGRQPIMQAER